jgi:putative ABC transport system ATP-binding protein
MILEAKQVFKQFQSGQETLTVLNGIDLSIARGESVTILGSSGSGKSTLLGILAGLDVATQGEVLFNGKSWNTMSESQTTEVWGKQIGFLFQSFFLLPSLTAQENVQIPLELAGDGLAEQKAKDTLAQVGLSKRLNHLPIQLSGGEQQRVALARALVHQPQVLFADEPTGNLDNKTAEAMAELLFFLVRQNKTTLVLVTHEMWLANKASRVLELKNGKIHS